MQFKLVHTLDISVPKHYRHKTCFTDFSKQHGVAIHVDPLLSDDFCGNGVVVAKPGDMFRVKFFVIPEGSELEDWYTFLDAEKSSLLGAQGLVIVNETIGEQVKSLLPSDGSALISLGEQWALIADPDASDYLLPAIELDSDGAISLSLMLRENALIEKSLLVSFEKIS